jgi:hypothetical protein
MTRKENFFYSGITNSLLTDYYNECTNNKSVTCSEFFGFTMFGENEYVIVKNHTPGEVLMDFVESDALKSYIIKKRFRK